MRFHPFGPRIMGTRGLSFSPQDVQRLVDRPARPATGSLEGSFVYVVRGDHNLCKIGVSTNPNARMAHLRTASSVPLSFAFIGGTDGTDGFAIEREAYGSLERCRVGDEWFDCLPETAIAAINGAAAKLGERLAPVAPENVDLLIRLAGKSGAKPRQPWLALAAITAMAVGVLAWQNELGLDGAIGFLWAYIVLVMIVWRAL
jgi:T5orf172 domain